MYAKWVQLTMISDGSRGGTLLILGKKRRKSQKEEKPAGQAKQKTQPHP